MYRLLLSQRMPDAITARYTDRFDLVMPSKEKHSYTQEEAGELIGDCDALFTLGAFPFRAQLIDRAVKLKAVGNFGTGYDNIDVEYCTQKGIFVLNTPEQVCESTAEFSIAIMMAITKGIVMYDRDLRKTLTCNVDLFFDRDIFLLGKTIGILGFGRIGQAVARKAQGLGMKVIYHDPVRQTLQKEEELKVRYCPFDELLRTADVVTCHMPYTETNRHLIDEKAFDIMKPTAYLINMARGPIMKEASLAEALRNHKIRGAATDVFEFEPHVSEELAANENVVITPHVGSNVLEAKANMVEEALMGIFDVLHGRRPHNVVNTDLYDR